MLIYVYISIPNVTIAGNTAFLGITPHGVRYTTVNAINLSNGHVCILAVSSNGSIQTTSDSSTTIVANCQVIISGTVPLII